MDVKKSITSFRIQVTEEVSTNYPTFQGTRLQNLWAQRKVMCIEEVSNMTFDNLSEECDQLEFSGASHTVNEGMVRI